jgi:N utilization substance protein A
MRIKIKKIEKDLLQGIIEETLSLIVKRKYGNNANFEIVVNMQKGDLEIYLIKQVVDIVEDDETEISIEEANKYSLEKLELGDDFIEEITLDNIADSFGRRLVSYASQAMNQKIHDVARNNIYQEYSSKIGQMIVGEIFQKRAFMMLVVHNGIEMKILRDDQLPTDNLFYKKNKAIKAVIKSITNKQGGAIPEILLSRRSDDFVRRLFEMEVPEVNDGIVQIMAIAREPGERMKIALSSGVDKVDPIGACVGLKGIRINSIIRELGNENIDLISWSDDPKIMIEKALLPAKIKDIEIFPDTKTATVIVSEDQISIAIGKNGQNARLASILTEYEINLLKEGGEDIDVREFATEIGDEIMEKLLSNEIETAREFLEADINILLNNCKMDYESIIEIRRVILLEFDETEDDNYTAQLKELTGNYTKEEPEIEIENSTKIEELEEEEIEEVEDEYIDNNDEYIEKNDNDKGELF